MNEAMQSAPKLTERARAQRERILCAAHKCFVEHGFHAAGMALIAETAEMSPGLIYRYFESKEAIILAIVERQLENARTSIRALYESKDFAAGAFECFVSWRDGDPSQMNIALFLEMSAEGKRNPALAAALHKTDQEVRKELAAWLAASCDEGGKGLPSKTAEIHALALQCFMEGLAIRAVREPDLSPAILKAAIARFVESLLTS